MPAVGMPTPSEESTISASPQSAGRSTVTREGDLRFADLGLPPVLVHALRRDGIDRPFPIQAAAIPDIIAGRDVLGRAATGSGKTLAFGLPLLVRLFGAPSTPRHPRGLILAPTRELAIQIETALDEPALSLGLRLATAVGGLPIKKQEERLARGVDIVIATPGRLTDLLGRKAVRLSAIQVVTVDEADHMAELGFMPQLTALLNKVPAASQKLLFSATLDETIDGLVQKYLRDPVEHAVSAPAGRDAAEGRSDSTSRDTANLATVDVANSGAGAATGANSATSGTAHSATGDTANSTATTTTTASAGAAGANSDATTTKSAGAAGATTANSDATTTTSTDSAGTSTANSDATITASADAAGESGANSAADRPVSGATPAAVPDISHYALHIRRTDKRAVVTEIAARQGRTLLFVRTQHGADKLARRLREAGIGAVALHGGKLQNQRSRTLAAFADGTAPVLVATDVAARGLHIDDVSLVVHVDPPEDPKDYLHRTGRTARAGASGTVVTIVTPDDRDAAEQLARRAGVTVTVVEVRSGDRQLAELTGARRPSGRAVADPAAGPAAQAKEIARDPRWAPKRAKGESRPHNKKRKPGAAKRSAR
ncbi:DEAD/DEAH box helicase [Nocardia yamanashiensis]|uniref:DEAD/DEAH box helicase n=1 Tax=Nocardia yamanashiensis TaxID=209247 RepID=UPI001E2ED482|nr:DEAD/DEAH box helicase [Nocardia yamanashiensis]UGT44460.1 DEAD/DEAH box helicase [Nocardia yamanashiensis]